MKKVTTKNTNQRVPGAISEPVDTITFDEFVRELLYVASKNRPAVPESVGGREERSAVEAPR